MKKIAVQNLAMIVTGACNLDCKHCLRGKKCNIKMSEEVISATLNQIVSIGNLCICGGEPLLALDVIEKIFNYIIENKILVDKVTIVINGTIYSDTFLHMLKEIDRYIGNVCKKSVFFRISYDKYHMEEIKKLNLEREYIENYKKYRESKYFEGLQILDPTLKLYREGNAIFLDDSLTVPLRQIGFAITYVGKGNLTKKMDCVI